MTLTVVNFFCESPLTTTAKLYCILQVDFNFLEGKLEEIIVLKAKAFEKFTYIDYHVAKLRPLTREPLDFLKKSLRAALPLPSDSWKMLFKYGVCLYSRAIN